MDTPREPSEQNPATDGRSMSGKVFVVVFVALSLVIALIGTRMRITVRPKWQAAVASSSAKAAEVDAKAAASAKAQETQK